MRRGAWLIYVRLRGVHSTLGTVCFCFLFRGAGLSDRVGGGPLTERLKTLAPVAEGGRSDTFCLSPCCPLATLFTPTSSAISMGYSVPLDSQVWTEPQSL